MALLRTRFLCLVLMILGSGETALANQVLMTDCSGNPTDGVYWSHEDICVMGDLDCIETYPLPPWPVADIYIVVDDRTDWSPYGSRPLSDVMGVPNSVDGTLGGGGFYDVQIAFAPLRVGRFDVVIDEDEDGTFDRCFDNWGAWPDYILGNGAVWAFKVVDSGLEALIPKEEAKARSCEEAERWTIQTKDLIFGVKTLGCGVGEDAPYNFAMLCLEPLTDRVGARIGVKDDALEFVDLETWYSHYLDFGYQAIEVFGNRLADRYGDLCQDPPDRDNMDVAELGERAYTTPAVGESLVVAVTSLQNALMEEGLVVEAIRISVERFSGAFAGDVPDNQAIRIQAMAIREYASLLQWTLTSRQTALEAIREIALESVTGDHTDQPDSCVTFRDRVIADGFSAEEMILLTEAGIEETEIEQLRSNIGTWDLEHATEGSPLEHTDAALESTALLIAFAQELEAGAQTCVDTTSLVWLDHPMADAGGPYLCDEGSPMWLDGSGSSDPNGGSLTYLWDLDDDGIFGDAEGISVQHTWEENGQRIIGLKVTDSQSLSDLDYTIVDVASINDGPLLTSYSPDSGYVRCIGFGPLEFSVTAVDPDQDELLYEWTMDDSLVSIAGPTWVLHPVPPDSALERHWVSVRISDRNNHSPDNVIGWRIDILPCPSGVPEAQGPEAAQLWLRVSQPILGTGADPARIAFSVPESRQTDLVVYDLSGRKIRTLVSGLVTGGLHELLWDLRSRTGRRVGPGVYWIRMTHGTDRVQRKIVVLR